MPYLCAWCTTLNKKIASTCIIAVMTSVVLGTFLVNRAAAQALKANVVVESGLNPFPKVVANDLDIVYVMIMAGGYGGTGPYTIEVWLRQRDDPWQRWAIYDQMYGSMPVLWSTNAPTTEAKRYLDIYVRVTDSVAAMAVQELTILIPLSSPIA